LKRRRRTIKGNAGLKQHQSCAKALSVAVMTISSKIELGKMKHEELDNESGKRFRNIQRRYGYVLFMECAPEVIKRMTEVPRITMNFNGEKRKVFMQVEYLKKYYEALKGEI